jgi:hypothetical protein|tara:strand:- start:1263 stop:1721 length:459 start_codon:yes stop_codon:yes gene_type:complete
MAEQAEPRGQGAEGMVKAVSSPKVTDIACNAHWVGPAIHEILDANPMLTFTPGDVYAACVQGAATLWTTPEGFVVTTGETDVFTGDRTMLIWLAWAYKRGTSLVAEHQEFFVDQAREGGFNKLEVRSAVPELKDYILSQGWKIDTIVYTRDV